MKRSTLLVIFVTATLLLSGCHDAYYTKIDELEARVAQLQIACDQINTNIASIQAMVTALESYDMISGITSITENGVVTGYKINFVSANPITIYHGTNGLTPLIGSSQYTDGQYYWTIQYGAGTTQWITDNNGNKILAMGVVPYIRVRSDRWQISYDRGKTWNDIGQASGEDGDSMFKSIDTSDQDYVIITLTNGTVFKIPTFYAYEQVVKDVDATNSNVDAQKKIIGALLDSATYIKSVSPVVSGSETVGTRVELSNGQNFTISNYIGSNVPLIAAKQDTTDHLYYWAMHYGSEADTWILDNNGNRILAVGQTVEAPLIGVTKAADGNYYWSVTVDGKTSLIIAPDGTLPHALDSLTTSLFSAVDNTNPDYLKLTLKDGTEYFLPKMYSVAIPSALTMAPNSSALIKYRIYGDTADSTILTFITQGGFTVKKIEGSYLSITSPASFGSDLGKIVVIFSINNSTKTVVKTITITEG
ncbi:MAG: PL29 family lyase N-terminal domain-containing protein [Bacteroidales bacterium]|nr:PL29 family lyase N-terminal domain-containing protein [Bacteroidales bacterium]